MKWSRSLYFVQNQKLDLVGPDVQPVGWASPTAQAAEDWLGQKDEMQKRGRDKGMDMGM